LTSRRPHSPDPDLLEADTGDPKEVTVRLTRTDRFPTPRRAAATLRVVAGRDMLQYAVLHPGEAVLIGRDEGAQLRLNDLTVSKRHASIEMDETGAITVLDLGSTNGTAVNGRSVRRTALRPGDHLEVGAVSLRLDLLSQDELAHLGRVLERLAAANRDPLTGLVTRAWLEDELPTLADRCDRAGVPFACAFVDIDHFKLINDRFGHGVGDDVLAGVARLLLLGVRDADPCVRYGGEEAVMFLPGSTSAAAAEVAERVRRSIATHDWDRTAPGLRVTASFGVAQRHPGEPLKAWIHRADEALYAAKRLGRDRVELARDRPSGG